ncbi:MAG: hypothetical protein OEZ52_09800, partial [Candidatus Aminicenantes bacterium]|nr:hypothetical protein [Candidatus Aminicenantes bacterium]
MNKKKVSVAAERKIKVLIYCPSDLILSGILRALESSTDIEVINIEKSTIESFLESIKTLKPYVILFAKSEPLPNIREICKAIRELSKTHPSSQLMLLGNIPSQEEIVSLMNTG